jgi:glyoxalase family protein
MPSDLLGIHHVTAIAGDPQRNLDFYTQVLGLRLVKMTVNFDDPETYHLYFGDAEGSPGTLLTFFPWSGAEAGREGAGQASAVALAIREASLGFWIDRLEAEGLHVDRVGGRFHESVVELHDPDGLRLELVTDSMPRRGHAWEGSPVPPRHAILALDSVTLTEASVEQTAELLVGVLGFSLAGREGDRYRFVAGAGGPKVDVVPDPYAGRGRISVGSVHHVAWRAPSDTEQRDWRARLRDAGLHVTPIAERKYFRSIYFREPGGVLFEIATDGPGFAVDESREELGSRLVLPPWLEAQRAEIERVLPALELPTLVGA